MFNRRKLLNSFFAGGALGLLGDSRPLAGAQETHGTRLRPRVLELPPHTSLAPYDPAGLLIAPERACDPGCLTGA